MHPPRSVARLDLSQNGKYNETIRSLTLYNQQLGDSDVDSLSLQIRGLNLALLDISHNNLTDESMGNVGTFTSVTEMNLNENQNITTTGLQALVAGLVNSESLTALSLSGNQIVLRNDFWECFPSSVTYLDLSRNPLQVEMNAPQRMLMFNLGMPNLQRLFLNDCGLEDQFITSNILSPDLLPELFELHLDDNRLTDSSASPLRDYIIRKRREKIVLNLYLCSNQFGARGVTILRSENVRLDGNPGYTALTGNQNRRQALGKSLAF